MRKIGNSSSKYDFPGRTLDDDVKEKSETLNILYEEIKREVHKRIHTKVKYPTEGVVVPSAIYYMYIDILYELREKYDFQRYI